MRALLATLRRSRPSRKPSSWLSLRHNFSCLKIVPEEGLEPSHLAIYDFDLELTVPEEGLEPSHLAIYDFESYASTIPPLRHTGFKIRRREIISHIISPTIPPLRQFAYGDPSDFWRGRLGV